jgi:hypothetical protein
VQLYACREGTWHRFGQSLPAFEVPQQLRFEPLYQVLFPAAVLPLPTGTTPIAPMRLSLQRDPVQRPTTAMICPLSALLAWVDTVPSARLERLHGVVRGGRILIVGDHLPLVDSSERFWGRLVLVPLGSRPDPDLPEAALREAAAAVAEELLVVRPTGVEAVPREAFGPLSRAALRLAVEDRP